MAERKKLSDNKLSERVVRNDDIFCSLLSDKTNGTIRVIDFRGGNFQSKHTHLERILMADRMRKIVTLIERDDMTGWQRIGYLREGTIPGYYKRSDAYIMGKVYDEDWEGQPDPTELSDRKVFLEKVAVMAEDLSKSKTTGLRSSHIAEEEAPAYLKAEWDRLQKKVKKPPKAKAAKGSTKKQVEPDFQISPVFNQFSREIEYHHFICQSKRTKQLNLFGSEYQDCFGNAKINVYFSPKSKADCMFVRYGLNDFIDWLAEIGAVSIFAMVPATELEINAVYMSSGFKNTGWLNRQLVTDDGLVDLVLWTKKLIQ